MWRLQFLRAQSFKQSPRMSALGTRKITNKSCSHLRKSELILEQPKEESGGKMRLRLLKR